MIFVGQASSLHFHQVSSRGGGEDRGYKACDGRRAQAYLNSTLSTAAERNAVDTALSAAAVDSW